MKTVLLSVIAAFFSLGAVAQGSRDFEYDRDQVRAVMEMISESTVAPGVSAVLLLALFAMGGG